MTLARTFEEIEYPATDGEPMGETDLHRKWMVRLWDLLSYHYRGRRVYVSGNLLVYYEAGDPSRYIVPDVFVATDIDPSARRVFEIWEEGKSPDVVFEVTSTSTQEDDMCHKPRLYAEIGVKEYFLYDPTSEYLWPPLQGFRLVDEGYEEFEPDESGALECQELGLLLRLEAGRLVIYDRQTGQPLRTEAEAERLAREAERQALQAERQAREAAEARADAEAQARQAAEQELQRLREQLKPTAYYTQAGTSR
jgi:Uma2 family endonuclease